MFERLRCHTSASARRSLLVLAAATATLGGCGGSSGTAALPPPVAAQTQAQAPARLDNAVHLESARVASTSPGACGTNNIAFNKSASASSVENINLPARAAFDGDGRTRWGSAFSDNQWLQVDLGSVQTLCGVTLKWEAAYAKAFKVELSNDATAWTPVYATTNAAGGTQTLVVDGSGRFLRLTLLQRATGYGYSLFEMQAFAPGSVASTPEPTTGYVFANPPVTGVTPSQANPPNRYFHEFQANCSVSRAPAGDDPIVYPNQPNATHSHPFLGNTTTNAYATLASLQAGATTCKAPADKSAYWLPTMYNGAQAVIPVGPQVIYYKTGVIDYTSVRPFPPGLRFVVGSSHALPAEFLAASVEGWECGNSSHNADFPSCQQVPGSQLNVRYQAPSCWDGVHLDSPNHQSHMAYPIDGRCTASHPVAVVMLEFKIAFPAGADTSQVRLSSGRGFSFHYDFYNAWEPPTLQALVTQCINHGYQCNARGYDETHPEAVAALGPDYRLH